MARRVADLLWAAMGPPLATTLAFFGLIALMPLAGPDHPWLLLLLGFALLPVLAVAVLEFDQHALMVLDQLADLTPRLVATAIGDIAEFLLLAAGVGQLAALATWLVTGHAGWWLWGLAGVPAVVAATLAAEAVAARRHRG